MVIIISKTVAFIKKWYFTITLLFIYIFFYIKISHYEPTTLPVNGRIDFNFISHSMSLIALFCFSFFWDNLLYNKNRIKLPLVLIFISLYSYFSFYYLHSKSRVEYSVLVENSSLIFTKGSLLALGNSLSSSKKLHLLQICISIPIFFFIIKIIETKFISKHSHKNECSFLFNSKTLSKGLLVPLLLWATVLIAEPIPLIDEFSLFARKIISYSFNKKKTIVSRPYEIKNSIITKGDYVFNFTPYETRPNIIVVLVESFNSYYVQAATPEGKEITPYFNSLIKKGYYVKNFYSPTIQSCRGQFSVLYSHLPSFRKKIFVDHEGKSYRGIQDILLENGYATSFVKAYNDINFDNTKNFTINHGFDQSFSLHELLNPDDAEKIYGWGVSDQTFYNHLPGIIKKTKEGKSPDTPFFIVLHTIMNHVGFNFLPPEKKKIYESPGEDRRKNYTNSIYATDQDLKYFINKLEELGISQNTIVVISGDHSFPTGHNGIKDNEAGLYDESFRTPLLIIGQGHIPAYSEINKRFSQLDIAPTILDLVGIKKVTNNFQGQSMVRKNADQLPIYLTQPYMGKILISIRYPYKYLYHLSTAAEFYYNLKNDPDEKKPLAATSLEGELLTSFHNDIKKMFANQDLIETDRLWINNP